MSSRILFSFLILFVFKVNLIQAQPDTIFNQTDSRGMKQGFWKKYYPNGILMYNGFFKDDKPCGEMYRYYESGGIKVVMKFTQGAGEAGSSLYYENGKLAAKGNYIGTEKDSTWEYFSFYDQSLKARETYNKGMRNGFSLHYYPDGTVSEKLEWKNNMKEGIWEQYYPDQKLMTKGTYKENKLNGPFYVYNENGSISLQGFFLNNLRQNKWIFYKEDMTIELEVTYNNGKPDKEDILTEKQKEIIKMIDENQGKYNEPDEMDFLQKGN
jgi:antitoxin component YwqK of YwqJK toxin-antitoxin module